MGNEILGKRPSNFFKGFNEAQVQYVKDKFDILKDDKGMMSKTKFQEIYHCPEAIAAKAIKFIDFTENGQVDEYEFLCGVAALCNAEFNRLTDMLFQILTDRKEKLNEVSLQTFTTIVLNFNRAVQGKPDLSKKQITTLNRKKFKKWDYDGSQELQFEEFKKMCLVDKDYKQWMFSMGFITHKQLENEGELYDEIDSDLEQEFKRHTTPIDPNENNLKKGIEHCLNHEKLQEFGGDEKGQIIQKPLWRDQVKNIGMTDKESGQPPSQNLTLEYVYGFRSYDGRNNLKYNSKGKVVYHAGALGIVLDQKENRQDFMMSHTDDVTCLDINKDQVVTGELGLTPIVVVWNSERADGELKVEHILAEGLSDSVGNITISQNRPYIAASCNNQDHEIVIYDLKLLRDSQKDPKSKQTGIIARGKSSKSVIVDLRFTTDEKMLVAATSREILFMTFKNKTLKSIRGNFSQFSQSIPVTLTVQDSFTYSGMTNNAIYIWEKQVCTKTMVGHQATVTALCPRTDKKGILSGDKLGNIFVWNDKFAIEKNFQLTTQLCQIPGIVALSMIKSNILVGTRGSDILEFRMEDKNLEKESKRLMSGHYGQQLKAMCIHPKNGCLYTGGEDRQLMKWKYLKEKRLEKAVSMSNKIRCLDVSLNLNTLAVGYSNGIIEFFDAETLAKKDRPPIVNFKNPDKEIISLIKFDREGKYLLVCYTPPTAFIMLYDMMSNTKKAEAVMKSKVLNADFSNDGKYIQLNTQLKDYLVYTLPNLQQLQQKNLGQIKDQTWYTQTLTMAAGLEGIFTPGVSEKDVTCCQISPINEAKRKRTIIVGDNYSQLKLYNYPTFHQGVFNRYKGHSSYVSAVRFTEDEKYVVSVGGQEKAILLWKYDPTVVENKFQSDDKDVDEDEGEQADPQQLHQQQLMDQAMQRRQAYDEFDIVEVEDEQGEEAMATLAFAGNIKAPQGYDINEAKDNRLPDRDLTIQFAFGVRNCYLNDQVRNQCRYTKDYRQIVFPTAALGVKMELQSRNQSFMRGHMEDIVSLAIDPRREIVATGQMAQKNPKNPKKKIVSICIFDVDNCELLKVLEGFHTIAVVLLEFSPDSRLLFSCGNDDKNSYAVYDWKAGIILHNGPISGAKVNGIAWRGEEFATCGNKHVKFWSKNKGIQGKIQGNNEAMFSICCSNSVYITGSGNGNLYNWVGDVSSEPIKAHSGCKVHTLKYFSNTVYSGGDDGLVLAWKTEKNGTVKQPQKYFDVRNAYPRGMLQQVSQLQMGVLSIDCSPDGRMLLVTTGCDILQLDAKKNCDIAMSGHCRNELWGLAVSNQTDDNFVTAGDDGTVRLWSISQRKMLSRVLIKDRVIRGVDWSNDGKQIVAADNKAMLYMFNVSGNELKQSGKEFKTKTTDVILKRNSKKALSFVEEIKFSPNGRFIVFGAHAADSLIELVVVDRDTLKEYKVYKGNSSSLLHADWNKNSDIFSTNSQSYELMFYGVNDTKQISATACRNEDWATWTRKIGWQVLGIFQGVDFTDVNTVCADRQKKILAVGYDDQAIRLFSYPAYVQKQVCKEYYAHSSHVTRVKFNNEYLISVGGNDKTIIVWNVIGKNKGKLKAGLIIEEESTQAQDIDVNVDLPAKAIQRREEPQKQKDQFEVVIEGGEEFMAVKPWIGAIKEPATEFNTRGAEEKPQVNVQLEYVYGYRSKDCRQNLFYCDKNSAVYHAAAVVIFHNFSNNTQVLITDHNDDIISMAWHPRKKILLTGQLGPKPLICMIQDDKVVRKWRGIVTKGVLCLGISPSGNRAVCVGMDDKHQVAVIDLQREGKTIAKAEGGRQIILKTAWLDEETFITVGIKHFKLWHLDNGKLKSEQSAVKSCFVSLAVEGNLVLTGAEKNELSSWRGSKQLASVNLSDAKGDKPNQAADPSLNSVVEAISIQENFIAAGCKNQIVFILSKKDIRTTLNVLKVADMETGSQCASVRSLDFTDNGSRMLMGTLASQIYEFFFSNAVSNEAAKKPINIERRMAGHYSPNNKWTNEVWGLCIDNKSNKFFTCSDDATLRCWDMKTRQMLSVSSLNWGPMKDGECKVLQKDQKTKDYSDASKGRVVALSPDRDELVVGCKNGVVRMYGFDAKTNSMSYKMMFRKATAQISDIKINPGTLVIGSHDQKIYVYDYECGKIKERFNALKKHSSYITHMDISRDSANLHSTCGAYELLFWDLNSGKQMTGGATMLRDEHWATWTTTLGWPVQGIWPKCADGTFYNAVDRSHFTINGTTFKEDPKAFYLLATGNDLGKVNIFNYPCLDKGALSIECRGHSSHVTNVRWSADDEYIISTGGEDQCVMQWRVYKTKTTTKKSKKV